MFADAWIKWNEKKLKQKQQLKTYDGKREQYMCVFMALGSLIHTSCYSSCTEQNACSVWTGWLGALVLFFFVDFGQHEGASKALITQYYKLWTISKSFPFNVHHWNGVPVFWLQNQIY